VPSRDFDRLLRASRAGKAWISATATAAVAATALILAQATLIADVIARATGHASRESLRPLLGWLIVVVAARAVVVYLGELTALRAAIAVKSDLRRALMSRAISLGPAWRSGQRTGELTTLLTRGLDALDPYFARYLPQLLLAFLLPVMVLVRVGWSDWPSALIIAVTLPLIPVFMVLIGMYTRDRSERQWQVLARLGGHFVDVMTGLPTLRLFNRSRAQAALVREATDTHRRRTLASLRVAFLSALVLELLATLAMALVAVEIGIRLLHGDVSYQTALLVLLLTPEAYLPLRRLGVQFHASMEGVAAAKQAFAVIDHPAPAPVPAVSEPERAAPIELRGVTVRYDGRAAPVLADAELRIEPGEHLFIAGPSGSGKSTVIAALLGLVQPDAGAVVVGDRALTEIDPRAWRRQLVWLPQRPHLFAGSVADNIALGLPDAPIERIREAAALAGADGFVRALPGGYDHELSEGGFSLSTGQRKRLALARTLVRDAPVILLDEPTAHLDADSAADVRRLVDTVWADRTVLWVSHEPEIPVSIDRIVTVGAGRIEALVGT